MILTALAVLLVANRPALQNPGFEESPPLAGWSITSKPQGSGRAPVIRIDRRDPKEGAQSLLIDSPDASQASVSQRLYLPIGSLWRIRVWTKTEALESEESEEGDRSGGVVMMATPSGNVGLSQPASGTTPWHQLDVPFRVPSPGLIDLTLAGVRGGSGKVWFDDIRLEPLDTPNEETVRILPQRATKRPISAMQQGQFIEILCNLIPSIIAQQVLSTSFEEAPPCKVEYKKEVDEPHRPWYPDGAVEAAQYSLDTRNPYNGSRSEKITIPVEHARAGISQDGFYLKTGVAYRVHLHMRGEGNVRVWATLHGNGEIIAGPALLGRTTPNWSVAQADLRSRSDITNATLTLDFEGPGTVWLDRVYMIGSDAVLGIWRPDVVAALKAVHPGVIRFGGSTIEDYEWTGGVGAWDERRPFTTVWGGLEENFVGIDEFLQLCQYVGAEPLICLRWTGKTPEDAAAEVEYCNGSAASPWGSRRARNGHPTPYHVKFWQIANEVDNPAYNRTAAAFAEAMRKADPSIRLISSFPTKGLLDSAGRVFDYLAPHHYEVADLVEEDRSFRGLEKWIAENASNKDTRIAVTEWNTTAGDFGLMRGTLQTLGNALGVARYLNLIQRHAGSVEIANRSNFADSFGSGFVLTGPGWIYESPAYYAQSLYARAAGSYPLYLERSSKLAWHLQAPDFSAALSPDGRTLRVYAVNSTLDTMRVHFSLAGAGSAAGGTVYTLQDQKAARTSEVMNSRDQPRRVAVSSRAAEVRGAAFDFSFRPITLTLLELQVQK